MLVKIYNMFCMGVTVALLIAIVIGFCFAVYAIPGVLISFLVIGGSFSAFAVVYNGTEQLFKFLENRGNHDGNKM